MLVEKVTSSSINVTAGHVTATKQPGGKIHKSNQLIGFLTAWWRVLYVFQSNTGFRNDVSMKIGASVNILWNLVITSYKSILYWLFPFLLTSAFSQKTLKMQAENRGKCILELSIIKSTFWPVPLHEIISFLLWMRHDKKDNTIHLFLKRHPSEQRVFPNFAREFIDLKLFYISNNELNSSCLDELIFLQEVFWKQTHIILALRVDWFIMQ